MHLVQGLVSGNLFAQVNAMTDGGGKSHHKVRLWWLQHRHGAQRDNVASGAGDLKNELGQDQGEPAS
jgi:hypothetical protein